MGATVSLTLLSVMLVKPGVTAQKVNEFEKYGPVPLEIALCWREGGWKGKLSHWDKMTPLSSAGEKGKGPEKQAE